MIFRILLFSFLIFIDVKAYCQHDLDSIFKVTSFFDVAVIKAKESGIKKLDSYGINYSKGGEIVGFFSIVEVSENRIYRLNTCGGVCKSIIYEFNDGGKLCGIQEYWIIEGKEKEYSKTEFLYDGNGRLVNRKYFAGEVLVLEQENIIEYSYKSTLGCEISIERVISRNSSGIYDTTVFRTRVYDCSGKTIEVIRNNGDHISESGYVYNPDGTLAEKCVTIDDSLSFCLEYFYSNSLLDSVYHNYFEEGRIKAKVFIYSDNFQLIKIIDLTKNEVCNLYYDDQGEPTKLVSIKGINKSKSEKRYEYNRMGHVSSEARYLGNKLVFEKKWHYTY